MRVATIATRLGGIESSLYGVSEEGYAAVGDTRVSWLFAENYGPETDAGPITER